MNSVLEYIQNNPQEAQRLMGLKYEQLQQLVAQAQELDNQKQEEVESRKIRIIASFHRLNWLSLDWGAHTT